jgi:hypothetical protein
MDCRVLDQPRFLRRPAHEARKALVLSSNAVMQPNAWRQISDERSERMQLEGEC